MQSAASDLLLLEAAARAGGAIARAAYGADVKVWSKGAAGPVTEIDLAIDKTMCEALLSARPAYGWLSEETPDTPERLSRERVFVLDPLDGTSSFLGKRPQFTVCVGVVEAGRAIAGAIYNPITDEMFLGGQGAPATLNGKPIRAGDAATLKGARIISRQRFFDAHRWPAPWPKLNLDWREAISYRLAAQAAGAADAVLLPGLKHEWDVAAGAAIVEAAGGRVSDPWGGELVFNQPDPRVPGLVAAGPALHALLIERLASLPDPRKDAPARQESAT